MTLLYFTAPWCVPCRSFGPVMDTIDAPIRKVDVDKFPEVATNYGVFSVPTVIALTEDDRELGRFSGAREKQFVERFIASHA